MQNETPETEKRKPGRPRKPIITAEERALQIREESERLEREQSAEAKVEAAERQRQHEVAMNKIERVDADAAVKQKAAEDAVEDAETQRQVALVKEVSTGDMREHLLQRIRDMRNEKPKEVEPIGYTPDQLERLNVEQEAGRAAVARAEAEAERNRELRRKYEEEERQRLGSMETVHRPNEPEQRKWIR